MASKTDNLKLTIQEQDEFYDVDIFNQNFEILDTEVFDRVKKNPEIKAKKKTKISYDEKGLVTGGEDLVPEDIPNLHISKIEGRAPVIYINDTPIYGCRFFDVDETRNAILREDGSGDYLLSVLENGKIIIRDVVTQVTDNLDSTNAEEALSAKQGHVLSGWIGNLLSLLTTAKISIVEAVNELFNGLKSHIENASNPHGVTKAQIGLGNVENTSDINKPISTSVQRALDEKVETTAFSTHTLNTSNPHGVTKTQIGLGNVDNVKQAPKTEFDTHVADTSNPHGVTKEQVGLANVDNTADVNKNVLTATKLKTARKINGVSFNGTVDITITDDTKIPLSQKGSAGGVAELDSGGKVPSSQLPSYVDDVIEGTLATFPAIGESGKIYIDTDTGLTYRWSGSTYVEISKSLALGETVSTAYAGNKGKKNADDIAELKIRATTAESDIDTLQTNVSELEVSNTQKAAKSYVDEELGKKVNTSDNDIAMTKKADLISGTIPDEQLPYYNKTQNIYADGILLYPVTFVDIAKNGDIYLREDGSGEYLIYVSSDGVPRVRYTGNAITDDITGVSYSFAVSNGIAVLKEII